MDARSLGLLAVVLATVNLVGGFVVTDRMLEMFKGRSSASPPPPDRADRRRPDGAAGRWEGADEPPLPDWTALLYLVAAVCFILALKGLSSPRTARRGNLIGAGRRGARRRDRRSSPADWTTSR